MGSAMTLWMIAGVYRIHQQPAIPSEDSDFVQNCATDLEANLSILHSFSYVVKTLPLSPCFASLWCRQGMRPRFRWAASQRGTGRCRFHDDILSEIRTDLGLGDGSIETR